MTRNEYEQRKQRLEAQRRESVELLEAFYRQQFLALELVWMANSGEEGVLPRSLAVGTVAVRTEVPAVHGTASAPPPASIEPAPARPRRWRPGELLRDVAAVLPGLPEVFDYHQVRQALGSQPERSSLFRVLHELVTEGTLAVEKKGAGRIAARYRKTAPEGA
jgi:hypothetical protein